MSYIIVDTKSEKQLARKVESVGEGCSDRKKKSGGNKTFMMALRSQAQFSITPSFNIKLCHSGSNINHKAQGVTETQRATGPQICSP